MKNKFILSFIYAFKGIKLAIQERNFKLHIGSTLIALLLAFLFKITPTEWCIVLLCIGLVLMAEVFNTAIEKIVNFISPEYNDNAGKIKDLAAAAVLLISIVVAIVAGIIFIPYILK